MKQIATATVLLLMTAGISLGNVPPILNHQGMLTDDVGAPLSGDYYMVFKFYETETGGSAFWSEAQLVTVNDGVFNVYLGQVAPLDPGLFHGQDIWLGVTVASDSEMTPRLRMGSTLYAFTAQQLSGIDPVWFQDADDDGWGNPAVSVSSPTQPAGYVDNSGDCDDTRSNVNPDEIEDCDGLDNDCNSVVDDGLTPPPCSLNQGVCSGATMTCGGAQGWLDCDLSEFGPDYQVTETVCDGVDNDCDGQTDEDTNCDDGAPCTIDYCELGGCTHEIVANTCYIAGQCYGPGDPNPVAECLECNPAADPYNWTAVTDGTACSSGQCVNGTCTPLFR